MLLHVFFIQLVQFLVDLVFEKSNEHIDKLYFVLDGCLQVF